MINAHEERGLKIPKTARSMEHAQSEPSARRARARREGRLGPTARISRWARSGCRRQGGGRGWRRRAVSGSCQESGCGEGSPRARG